jgi:hypothetical protein
MALDRDSVLKMCGECLRESAVLVAVFGPLEGLYRGLTARAIGAIVGLTTVLLVFGMVVERKRKS